MHTIPSQELFFILLALATLLPIHFPGFYSQQDESCSDSFQCGNITNIKFPFWGGRQPQACGLSGFQLLDCDGDFPLLIIPPLIYRVLEFHFSNRTLKVARQDLLNPTCPTTSYNTTLQGPYHFVPNSNDQNITLFFNCVVDMNEELTSLAYLSGCMYLFTTGDASSGPGPGIPPAQSPGGSTIANAVAVVGTGVLILSVIICCCYLKRRSRPAGPDKENIEKFLLQHGSLAHKRYKYSEIKKITKYFKHKLGQGGFGSVYQGMLPDGSLVAVKVLINSDSNGEEFINEVASISRTSHVNIVNLLGFCYDGNKKALVYEFMPNKSLDKFISNNADSQLDCEKLYKIAVGVAKGLEYLHTGCNTRIVHFDIKPQNILLDDDFCPKISDFGLAKLCKKKQSILSMLGARGTIGYIAPEVFSRNYGGVSHKSDVYSYGMMVLEMAGAKKIVEPESNAVE
ncbi:UNVERIFIED_CONTAM: LEAF RUST 10 DISEASE-RESISTANCE LOCUS RECEPTOR-LIKE PROTEIN KINASE-like 2.1 [Sesamum radiatum]|uniref:non-specific serine/threonine protein kinase n=1 Tax=Sesamum radiatum TaxID=300843 RepID=A0AAW2VTA5_SESRA